MSELPIRHQTQLAERLSYFCGITPNPLGQRTSLAVSLKRFRNELEHDYPKLGERGLGMAALLACELNGKPPQGEGADAIEIQSLAEGATFNSLFTIGFGLIKDSYRMERRPVPEDVEQSWWFDDSTRPLTHQQFFDCLELAQYDITEKYPGLQLVLQDFVKSPLVVNRSPSAYAPALASIAASELHNAFEQMEAARE